MPKNRTSFLWGGAFLLLIFVFFSYFVHNDVFNSFDFNTTVRLQDKLDLLLSERNSFDIFLSTFSLIGSFEVATLIILLILALKRSFKLLSMPLFYGLLHIVELFGKVFVTHIGPPFMFLRYDIPFLFPSTYVQPGFSYPSGHAARTIFISAILLYFLFSSKRIPKLPKLIIAVLLIFFDVIMLVSRIYLGEHWTTDVIGGSLLGGILAIFSLIFLPSKHSLRSNDLTQGGRESNPQ